MPDSDPLARRLLDWLRHRKLLQILAIYAAASWAILEVTDVFIDKLGLPAWFFPAAIILLLIGLAMVTTTAIVEYGAAKDRAPEAKPEPLPKEVLSGRLPSLTWPRAILGGVLAFGALAAVGTVWVLTRDAGGAAPVVDPGDNAVAVLPFRTRGEGLEVWREGLMDVLSANLDGVGDIRALDARTVLSHWRNRFGESEAPAEAGVELGRDLGARWVVQGQAVELGGQVRMDIRFISTEDGSTVASSDVVGPPDSILALLEGTTLELLRGLGAERGLGDRGRAFTSTSLEAVKAYLEGEQAMRRARFETASDAFERALEIDSTFAMAAARLSEAYGWRYSAGHPAARAAAEQAFRFADRLPPRERGLLELTHLLESGRGQEMIRLARVLTSRYPSDPEIWHMLGEAYYHLGYIESISREESLAPFDRAVALDSSYLAPLMHLTELSGRYGSLELFDRYTEAYLARDSTSEDAIVRRVAHALVRGNQEDSLAAEAELETMDYDELRQVVLQLLAPRWSELMSRVAWEMADPRHPLDRRSNALYFWVNLIEAWRGRPLVTQEALAAAERLGTHPDRIAFWRLVNLTHGFADPERTDEIIQDALEQNVFDDSLGRWVLALYYLRAGDGKRAAAHVDTLRTKAANLRAEDDTAGAMLAEGLAEGLEGLTAARRGDHAEAVSILRGSIPKSGGLGSNWVPVGDQMLTLAASLVELGDVAEAIRILEGGTFQSSAYFEGPAALFRGQLYEQRGEREKAIRAYSLVADLWKESEPPFRPQWETAVRALERLQAQG